jgi:L-2,4-diaminobutyrate decarboxylase
MLASEHAHYSVARAAGIMGIGTASVVKIATDAAGRMRPDVLQAAHQQAIDANHHVIAVVATAGCTPTGSIDPLHDIGTYCRAHGLWLHVDGAHGASALLSDTHRQALNGIALADSVTWDGHKLLYMPATVSAVLFRQPETSYAAFAQDASYLFQGEHQADEEFNISYRTLECTKRMMGLKLWTAFSLYGVSGLSRLVEQAFENARLFAELINASSGFELLMQPETNIVCFRYVPRGLTDDVLGEHQSRIRNAIIESGAFHLTQVKLEGNIWLRTTLMNPFIEKSHLEKLLSTIRKTSNSLLA